MEDLNLDELEKEINNKNAVEDRIRNLHSAKKEAEDKLQAESKARQELEARLAGVEKETTFLNSFSDTITKFPQAGEYRDKIKEKVLGGYSMEDATIAILHAEGKLNSAPKVERMENVTGGSAPNQITNNAPVSPGQMTQAQRFEALREAEKRGELFMS
jgi:hypothetical protein